MHMTIIMPDDMMADILYVESVRVIKFLLSDSAKVVIFHEPAKKFAVPASGRHNFF